MEELLREYMKTVKKVYERTKELDKETERYRILFTEYQELCMAKRAISSYCKLVNCNKKEKYVLQIRKMSYNKGEK